MASLNQKSRATPAHTHGGAPAALHVTALQTLRRSVMSCLLWESGYYEDGQSIAERIDTYARQVKPQQLSDVAFEARSVYNLRHVPLLLLAVLAQTGRGQPKLVADSIERTIQRADELAEFIQVYARVNGVETKAIKPKLSAQVKQGLARAFTKFSPYSLAKYNRDNEVKLRDVLFLCHAKPKDEAQAAVWKQLIDGNLAAPDTWEVALSAGADKRETFERLLREESLGYLALLRNLRNMTQAGVDLGLVRAALLARKGAERVLPFRYVAAARACPQLEPAIDQALSEAIADLPVLPGRTVVLVDISGSMDQQLSAKSDMKRMDAAAALASLINGDVRMFSFSDRIVEVPPRRGMAGVDAILKSQPHSSTALASAVAKINEKVPYDRLICITDEQATDGAVPVPKAKG
jgi:60 kDa SS-A/Ro ribonucleoprotein